jgi:Mrp family chromosome partitioning ATPase
MSRIDEALRRARDGRVAEPQKIEIGYTLQEYPHEHRAAPDGDVAAPPVITAQVAAPVSNATLAVEIPPSLIRQCQRIAAILHERQAQNAVKIVAVASASTGEGKTSTVLALALALTRTNGSRVLVVDADLCRPTLHEAVRVKQGTGLLDIISRDHNKAAPVVVHPTLHMLLAGRASTQPAVDLGSERLRALLKQCATHYDWVLVDTPAMSLLVDDADVVGRLAEAVVFVVGAKTAFTAAERAMATIGEGRILGTVLNGLAELPALP